MTETLPLQEQISILQTAIRQVSEQMKEAETPLQINKAASILTRLFQNLRLLRAEAGGQDGPTVDEELQAILAKGNKIGQ